MARRFDFTFYASIFLYDYWEDVRLHILKEFIFLSYYLFYDDKKGENISFLTWTILGRKCHAHNKEKDKKQNFCF